jgi:hypothetical protein
MAKYFSDNAGPARISVAGQLISAAALGVFAVSVFNFARQSGRGSEGIQAAALARGIARDCDSRTARSNRTDDRAGGVARTREPISGTAPERNRWSEDAPAVLKGK